MAGNLLEFTEANFEADVLGSAEPVLVDVWATWCGPCKMIAPAVEQLADEYAGKARVGKLNMEQHPRIAAAHKVSALPALLVFKDGKVVERTIGVAAKGTLAAMLNRHLT